MKGWRPVSLSAGQIFPYPEKVERMLETTSYHYIKASHIKILQKHHHHHHYHHFYHHHHHPNHHYHHHHHHSFFGPGINPVWCPLEWRKHIIITIILIKIIFIIIIIIIIVIITIVIAFLPPCGANCVWGP